jgi:hypothetical protein
MKSGRSTSAAPSLAVDVTNLAPSSPFRSTIVCHALSKSISVFDCPHLNPRAAQYHPTCEHLTQHLRSQLIQHQILNKPQLATFPPRAFPRHGYPRGRELITNHQSVPPLHRINTVPLLGHISSEATRDIITAVPLATAYCEDTPAFGTEGAAALLCGC